MKPRFVLLPRTVEWRDCAGRLHRGPGGWVSPVLAPSADSVTVLLPSPIDEGLRLAVVPLRLVWPAATRPAATRCRLRYAIELAGRFEAWAAGERDAAVAMSLMRAVPIEDVGIIVSMLMARGHLAWSLTDTMIELAELDTHPLVEPVLTGAAALIHDGPTVARFIDRQVADLDVPASDLLLVAAVIAADEQALTTRYLEAQHAVRDPLGLDPHDPDLDDPVTTTDEYRLLLDRTHDQRVAYVTTADRLNLIPPPGAPPHG